MAAKWSPHFKPVRPEQLGPARLVSSHGRDERRPCGPAGLRLRVRAARARVRGARAPIKRREAPFWNEGLFWKEVYSLAPSAALG